MHSVDYTKLCFTPVDSMNFEDQRTRPISYGIVKKGAEMNRCSDVSI